MGFSYYYTMRVKVDGPMQLLNLLGFAYFKSRDKWTLDEVSIDSV